MTLTSISGKAFQLLMWKMSFPPFQPADHVLRRQGKATGMIPSQIASTPVCFLISGLSTAQNCHPGDVTGVGVLLPEVWAQAGLLVSCLPQLTRHTGALRAVKQLNLAAFPIPLWPCPTLHMSLLDVLPPFPPPQQTLWTCSRDSSPPILFLTNVKNNLQEA